MSPSLLAYQLLTRWLEPLAPRLLDARVKSGKENEARVDERLGLSETPRPDGPLVWLHGVSVGETLSLLPLIERIKKGRPDITTLVTSGTVTSADILAQRLPKGVIHQFVPVDGPVAVRRFLDHWKPDLGIFVESELWPNLILEAKKRGTCLSLVSARITEKTAKNWSRFPAFAKRLLGQFDLVLPQDQTSADRLSALGSRVDGMVNLKLSGAALPHDTAAFSRLSAAIGDRPVIVAASTHAGEEIAIVRALDGLSERVCLILAPRHPERGPDIANALTRDGYRFVMRSRGGLLGADTDLYVADTLGELGLFLRLADIVIMGGSFGSVIDQTSAGGHNPLEPARLGKPAITGPDMENWQQVAGGLIAAGGLIVADTADDLPGLVAPLLADPSAARTTGERARLAAADAGSGLETLFQALIPLLPVHKGRS